MCADQQTSLGRDAEVFILHAFAPLALAEKVRRQAISADDLAPVGIRARSRGLPICQRAYEPPYRWAEKNI